MTKSELKGIIMECIDEIQTESAVIDEDQVELENCLLVESACVEAIEEGKLPVPFANIKKKVQDNIGERVKEEQIRMIDRGAELADIQKYAKKEAQKEFKKELGAYIKEEGGKIVPKTPKDAAIAAAVVAAIAAIAAGSVVGIKKLKKNKDQKKENGEEQKEENKEN